MHGTSRSSGRVIAGGSKAAKEERKERKERRDGDRPKKSAISFAQRIAFT